ncbi:hypothetical protein IHE44_0010198 [Lamprotornis superbus]|uniref:Uncharacterized protein n=1 Tax=Lamprotornis superbus TaxID=245042 RepID=A0A835NE06_9PASS|nr:hypothetical protein IHE44_0010198 [Lamprotornis superbus]
MAADVVPPAKSADNFLGQETLRPQNHHPMPAQWDLFASLRPSARQANGHPHCTPVAALGVRTSRRPWEFQEIPQAHKEVPLAVDRPVLEKSSQTENGYEREITLA